MKTTTQENTIIDVFQCEECHAFTKKPLLKLRVIKPKWNKGVDYEYVEICQRCFEKLKEQ